MNKTKEFFNNKASTWDQKEIHNQDYFDKFILEYAGLKLGDEVLDLGCGTGVISGSIFKITQNKVVGLDISNEMIDIAKRKYNENKSIEFICGDFYDFKHEKFDTIICHNAYPHFLDVNLFKKKCINLLKNNGTLIIIHSISREVLKTKHAGLDGISKELKKPDVEYLSFKDQFEALDMVDDDKMYLLKMRKR